MKHLTIDANYAILTKWIKLQKRLSIQSVGFKQTFMKFIEIFVPQEYFFTRIKM